MNQIKISFFLHVTATLHREPIIWDAFQATSFGTYTGHEILIFKRFQGWLFIKRAKPHRTRWWNLWWPQPQVFMTSWILLISIGQLNCEETITNISVALSCLSWGCFCSRDSISNQCRLNHGPNGALARAPELQGPRAAGSGIFLLLNFAVKILIDFMALMWL